MKKMKSLSWNTTLVMLVASVAVSPAPVSGLETAAARPSGQTEISSYCQSKYFHATCKDDEVIMMTSANYGRMRIDRCVTADFGYIGCERDVLDFMDWRCSGRISCSVRVLDDSFGNVHPCHEDLKSYLEVSYSCVKARKENASFCMDDSPVPLTNSFGYISGGDSFENEDVRGPGCGNRGSSWLLQAQPGQRINITLHDFSLPAYGSNPNSHVAAASPARDMSTQARCRILATIREDPPGRGSVTVCGGEGRLRNVYVSTGNKAEIRIWNSKSMTNPTAFLLQYEFIGCADLEAPAGGYTKRDSDMSVLVGCSQNKQTWRLVCNGTQWAGTWQNCSTAPMAANGSDGGSSLGFIPLPMKISIVIIVGLALAIGMLVLATGLVCLRRLPRHSRRGTPDGCRVAYGEHQHPPMEPLYPKATIVYRMRDTQTATSLQYPASSTATTTTSLPDYNNAKNFYSSMNRQSCHSCCRAAADEPDICTCSGLQLQESPPNIAQPDVMCSASYHALDPVDFGPGAYFEGDRKVLHFEADNISGGLLLSNEGTLNQPETTSSTAATTSSIYSPSSAWTNNSIASGCNPKRHVSITAHYTTNIFDDCGGQADPLEGANVVSLPTRTGDATL